MMKMKRPNVKKAFAILTFISLALAASLAYGLMSGRPASAKSAYSPSNISAAPAAISGDTEILSVDEAELQAESATLSGGAVVDGTFVKMTSSGGRIDFASLPATSKTVTVHYRTTTNANVNLDFNGWYNQNLSNSTAVTTQADPHGAGATVSYYVKVNTLWNGEAIWIDKISFGAGTPPPTDTTPPMVSLTSPAAGATLSGIASLTADASDAGGVARVEFYVAGVLIASDTASPYTASWDTRAVANGAYALSVRAYDAAGNQATSTPANVSVQNASAGAKTIHYYRADWAQVNLHYNNGSGWTAAPGQAMSRSGSWWTRANIGMTSATLEFVFNNGAGVWDNNGGRNYTTTLAEAWIKDGSIFASDPTDSQAPTVRLTAPIAGAPLAGVVALAAEASDNLGVAAVDFLLDGAVVGSDASAPYSLSWDSTAAPNGGHTVAARARDAAGNETTSAGVSVTVANAGDTQPPLVDLTAPIADSVVSRHVALRATASDDRAVRRVEFYVDGALVARDAAAPYGATWDSYDRVAGPHTVVARAVDVAGNVGEARVTVTTAEAPRPRVDRKDFREETIYFVLTTRFFDGDPSNNRTCRGVSPNGETPWRGDFKGLVERLDYIKALGFTAIWITPVVQNRSDIDYHGYHGWDFRQVDARLETPGYDFRSLIDEVHARGMKLVLDMVVNHTCRYGAKGLQVMPYWGNHEDPEWSWYYDRRNPDFEYNGLDAEPLSGKHFYNGDLWTLAKPSLSWTSLPGWNTPTQYRSPEGYKIWPYQWPNMELPDPAYYHKTWLQNWEDETAQIGTIHEDLLDLKTEDPVVRQYLIDAYNRYIDMGVDGFRIDTAKHVNRKDFNDAFVPAWKARGGAGFYMFAEVLTRVSEIWNKGVAPLSCPFYTWKERFATNDNHEAFQRELQQGIAGQPTSDNHALRENDYHVPDTSRFLMGVIDSPMHWNFSNAGSAFRKALEGDHWYNDATWNVVYVDSHDYGPGTDNRYAGSDDEAAENFTLMFTFRGIPTILYGSEIRFQKGVRVDITSYNQSLETTGRAYFGDQIRDAAAIDVRLAHPLAQHIARLNAIRKAVPALQKGQYSTAGFSGGPMGFKRRFRDTESGADSYVVVGISGSYGVTGILNGAYRDAVTGDVKVVTDGTMSFSAPGQGNMRCYVLDGPGKIGQDGAWLR
jgi:glycosidase